MHRHAYMERIRGSSYCVCVSCTSQFVLALTGATIMNDIALSIRAAWSDNSGTLVAGGVDVPRASRRKESRCTDKRENKRARKLTRNFPIHRAIPRIESRESPKPAPRRIPARIRILRRHAASAVENSYRASIARYAIRQYPFPRFTT